MNFYLDYKNAEFELDNRVHKFFANDRPIEFWLQGIQTGYRLTEDGLTRITENGNRRTLE